MFFLNEGILRVELGALDLAVDPTLAKKTRTTRLLTATSDRSNGALLNVNLIQLERQDPV